MAPGRYKWPLKAARGKPEHGNCSEKCINTGSSKARPPELVTCGRGYITARGMRTMTVMSYVCIMMALHDLSFCTSLLSGASHSITTTGCPKFNSMYK